MSSAAIQFALNAIEQGWSFDRIDNEVGPVLRDAIKNSVTIDSTGSTAVDNNYFWQPIATCPRGVKVQLIGDSGVAMYGTYNGKGAFYTHWAPLPKFKREVERCHGCEACIQTACGRDECPKGWVKP